MIAVSNGFMFSWYDTAWYYKFSINARRESRESNRFEHLFIVILFESGWRIVLISCYITGIATFYLSCAIITLNVSWKHTKPTYTFRFYQIVRLKLWYQVFFLFPLDFSYFSMMTASTNRSILIYSRLRRSKILKFTIKRNNLQ